MSALLGLSPLSKALSMRRALNINLLPSALALAVALPVAGYVQAQEIELDIPAQPLGSALQEFGRQANLQVLYNPSDIQSQRSTAVKGKLEPQQAIKTLLNGTRTTYNLSGSSLTINAATSSGPLELGMTNVSADQLGTITEGSGSYTPGTIATATRLVLSPRETPQSISVTTRQAMDDFNFTSINDVMRHTPGITVNAYDTQRSDYFSRGFSVQNFQIDGIPTIRDAVYASGQTLSDMAIYDRVEVLKGASGLLTGAGDPGGTINLIRKKPTSQFQGHASQGFGSWNNYRTEIDVSGPLTETGNVRGRAVAAYQQKDSYMDHFSNKTNVYYGILDFDLSPDTQLSVGVDYQDSIPKGSSWAGAAPLFDKAGNRLDMPRSFNSGARWASWEQYTRNVFATLEHSFANGWVAKGQYSHMISGYDAHVNTLRPPTADGMTTININSFDGETKSDSLDMYATGPFSLFGREHQLVVGAASSRAHKKGYDYWNPRLSQTNSYDFYNWDGKAAKPSSWGPLSVKADEITRQNAGYITAQFSLMDDLKLLLGSRVVYYSLTGTTDLKDTGKVLPYAGLIYDIDEHFSAYANYSEIFNPQNYRDSSNKVLEPDEGKSYELGIKGEFFEGRLNSSLAYFELHQENRAVDDVVYNGSHENAYASMGITAKTKGYEAEVSGELAPGWQLKAGYTHKVIRDQTGTKVSTWEPQDLVSLYTSYKLTGDLDRLTLGGGLRWQGKAWNVLSVNGNNVKVSQDPYSVVDLMARYQITDNVSTTLNVNNVLDKTYYSNTGFFNSYFYGEPRSFMVTTRWDF
ncbi:ferripyoverdine receptor [Pseudomonas sp. St29]|nr:ferripyoverdine receptor [Pseudomonas sp. St29]